MLHRTLHAGYKHETVRGPRPDEVGTSYVVGARRGLDALRHVLGEVLQFLDDAGCPQGLRDELARLLLEATGGDYALLRQKIDRALADGWGQLARELRRSAGSDDEDDGL